MDERKGIEPIKKMEGENEREYQLSFGGAGDLLLGLAFGQDLWIEVSVNSKHHNRKYKKSFENNDIHVRQWTQVTCVMAFTYQVCRRVLEARISQATTYSIV